jgi:hypothetical protein
VTLGRAERQGRLGNVAVARCEQELPQRSIYRLLHAERDRLFPDELFADLFVNHGRRSVPPSILAVVMVLQRLEGCSDREAVDRFCYDLRWRYAAGVDDDLGGFAHTVLVDLRARLRRSEDPDRIFRVTTQLARQLGLIGVRRVLDSAPLLDAVATQDTVSLVRGGIRGLLRVLPAELAQRTRRPTIAPPDPRSNANSRTCYADATADGTLACADWCGSARTGGCWPPRSTSPAWRSWASATSKAAGRWLWHRTPCTANPSQVGQVSI